MKITDIKVICLKYPYEHFIADGCGTCCGRTAALVLVETDAGLVGIGECATFGGSLTAVNSIIEEQLKPLLLGQNPLDIEFLWQRMLWNNWAGGRRGLIMGAISGIDIALWDIAGKTAGLPLYRLFGANSSTVRAYASAGFYAPGKGLDELKKEMEGYLNQGYSAFKIKIGRSTNNYHMPLRYMKNGDFLISMEEDLKRIETVRSIIGPDAVLMLDMNCTWSIDETISAKACFDQYNIFWIEEPARSDDVAGYARISSALPNVLVAGCESEQGLTRYRELLERNAIDVVQTSLGWCGGFTEAKKIAALSLAYNKLFSPHSFFSAVITAANIHLSASLPNVPFIESEENPNPFRTRLLTTPLEHDSKMNYIVPELPGLGIELNWDIIEKYRIN